MLDLLWVVIIYTFILWISLQLQRLGYKMSLQQQVENSLINSKSNSYSSSSNGSVPHQLNANNSNHNNSSSSSSNSNSKSRSNKDRERLRIERESLKIWTRPIDTFKYFVLECITLSKIYGKKWVNIFIWFWCYDHTLY